MSATTTDAAARPALLVEAEGWCTCADNVDEERTAHGSTGSFSRCLYCRLASALEAALEREARLREALRECADDLEAEIKARASGELPRRIARDLDTVERARAALGDAP